MEKQTPIERAVAIVGTQSALAAHLGVSRQFINQLYNGTRQVPPKMVLDVERATGGNVTRYELRPDIFGDSVPLEIEQSWVAQLNTVWS